MSDLLTIPKAQSAPAPARPRSHAAALFWMVVGFPLLMLVLAFLILPSRPFRKYGEHFWVTAQKDLYEASGRPCDIVIFGDSTAMTGLDPAIIGKATHMSTCNVAETAGALAVSGIAPLDAYLTRNPRPKYLLLQFSAADFHTVPVPKEDAEHFTDGFVPLLRYGSRLTVVKRMFRSPDTFTGLLQYVYFGGLKDVYSRAVTRHFAQSSETEGAYIVVPLPAMKTCVASPATWEAPDPAWVRYLREHYLGKADHVLLDVSPTSRCDVHFSLTRARLQGLTDDSLPVYPDDQFVDAELHLDRAGAVRLSRDTARQIREAQQTVQESKKAGGYSPQGS